MIRRLAALAGLVLLASSCFSDQEILVRDQCWKYGGLYRFSDDFPYTRQSNQVDKLPYGAHCLALLDSLTGEISVLDSLGNFTVVAKREFYVGKPSEKQ
jgi:hypothetical protein